MRGRRPPPAPPTSAIGSPAPRSPMRTPTRARRSPSVRRIGGEGEDVASSAAQAEGLRERDEVQVASTTAASSGATPRPRWRDRAASAKPGATASDAARAAPPGPLGPRCSGIVGAAVDRTVSPHLQLTHETSGDADAASGRRRCPRPYCSIGAVERTRVEAGVAGRSNSRPVISYHVVVEHARSGRPVVPSCSLSGWRRSRRPTQVRGSGCRCRTPSCSDGRRMAARALHVVVGARRPTDVRSGRQANGRGVAGVRRACASWPRCTSTRVQASGGERRAALDAGAGMRPAARRARAVGDAGRSEPRQMMPARGRGRPASALGIGPGSPRPGSEGLAHVHRPMRAAGCEQRRSSRTAVAVSVSGSAASVTADIALGRPADRRRRAGRPVRRLLRGRAQLSTAVLDSLEEPGGQITAMYPEKAIFDVAGFPAIKGRDLVDQLVAQAAPHDPTYLLGHQAVELERGEGCVRRDDLDRAAHRVPRRS